MDKSELQVLYAMFLIKYPVLSTVGHVVIGESSMVLQELLTKIPVCDVLEIAVDDITPFLNLGVEFKQHPIFKNATAKLGNTLICLDVKETEREKLLIGTIPVLSKNTMLFDIKKRYRIRYMGEGEYTPEEPIQFFVYKTNNFSS